MFLDKHDLFLLTHKKYPKYQLQWLVENGYKFDVAADGCPVVLKEYVQERLGLGLGKTKKKSSPNYDYFKSLSHAT